MQQQEIDRPGGGGGGAHTVCKDEVHEATRRLGGVLCINEFCGTWDLLEEFSRVLNWATTIGCMHACVSNLNFPA